MISLFKNQGRFAFALVVLGIVGILHTGCEQAEIDLNCYGRVTDFYTGEPISNQLIIIQPVRSQYSNGYYPDFFTPEAYESNNYSSYGAITSIDGIYSFRIEEKKVESNADFTVAIFDSSYISEIFTLEQNSPTGIDIVCKPLRTLCLTVDVVNQTQDNWTIEVLTDSKLYYFKNIYFNYWEPFQSVSYTYYFKVVPDADCILASRQYSFPKPQIVIPISNIDTTFYSIEL